MRFSVGKLRGFGRVVRPPTVRRGQRFVTRRSVLLPAVLGRDRVLVLRVTRLDGSDVAVLITLSALSSPCDLLERRQARRTLRRVYSRLQVWWEVLHDVNFASAFSKYSTEAKSRRWSSKVAIF